MTGRPFLLLLWLCVIALAAWFLFARSGMDFCYIIPKRLTRLGAMTLGGICVAVSTIIFQTVVGSRILTPAVMGYEPLYLFAQSLVALLLGGQALVTFGKHEAFLLSVALILGYSWLLQRWLLRRSDSDVQYLLLFGLILSMVFVTLAQFVQLRLGPGDFSIIQGVIYASFNKATPTQLAYAATAVGAICLLVQRMIPPLDVLALGRAQSIGLGLDYGRFVALQLGFVGALVAVSASLIGPTAFMGIFVANTAYAICKTTRHRATLPTSCAMAVGLLLLAQLLVERVFNYTTTVNILINMLCGTYFLLLVLRVRGRA